VAIFPSIAAHPLLFRVSANPDGAFFRLVAVFRPTVGKFER
jgi:hypothetical protein